MPPDESMATVFPLFIAAVAEETPIPLDEGPTQEWCLVCEVPAEDCVCEVQS